MHIITILTISTSEIEIVDVFNDELIAQNKYLDKVSELSKSDDSKVFFESIFMSKNKAIIHKREPGWVGYYKDAYKIVSLHHIADYNISDA